MRGVAAAGIATVAPTSCDSTPRARCIRPTMAHRRVHAVRLTGTVPMVNGGAWPSRSAFWRAARTWPRSVGGRVALGYAAVLDDATHRADQASCWSCSRSRGTQEPRRGAYLSPRPVARRGATGRRP